MISLDVGSWKKNPKGYALFLLIPLLHAGSVKKKDASSGLQHPITMETVECLEAEFPNLERVNQLSKRVVNQFLNLNYKTDFHAFFFSITKSNLFSIYSEG